MSYILSKLSKPVTGWLNAISGSAKNRTEAFAVALAYVISQRLTLPVERVEDVLQYFRLNHVELTNRLVDSVNEIAPVNTKLTRQVIESFYSYRYRSLFPLAIPLALRKDKGVEDFFGLSKCFADGVLSVIQTESEEITHYINNLTALLDEITAAQKWTPMQEEPDHYVA